MNTLTDFPYSSAELGLAIVDILLENPEGKTLRQFREEFNVTRSGARHVHTREGMMLDNALIHLKRKGVLIITKVPGVVRGGQNLYRLTPKYIAELTTSSTETAAVSALNENDPAYSLIKLLTAWKPIQITETREFIHRQRWYTEGEYDRP